MTTDGTGIAVRCAESGEDDVIAGILARAFLDDPLYEWVFPDRRRRERQLPSYMQTLPLTIYGSMGPVQVAVAERHVVGALVQCDPGQVEPSHRAMLSVLPGMLRSTGPWGFARLLRLDRAVGSIRPTDRHRYLFHLGTDPQWWGHGVGSALLRRALAESDAAAVPTYLECNPDVVPYYERFGFGVTRQVPIAAVKLWGMVRPAA